jgi:hypothetical protein
METSVFKDILNHSIGGDKIYGGSIDWLNTLQVDNLIVPSSHSGSSNGFGSIDGAGFSIGNAVSIGSVAAEIITGGAINCTGQIQGDTLLINGTGGSATAVISGGISASYLLVGPYRTYGISNSGLVNAISLTLLGCAITSAGDISGKSLSVTAAIAGASLNLGSGAITSGPIIASALTVASIYSITNSGIANLSNLNIISGNAHISSTGAISGKVLTATTINGTGDVNIGSGDIKINTIGKGLKIKTGTNSRVGIATISFGSVTISNTTITDNTIIILTPINTNDARAWVKSHISGTSFTIGCNVNTDVQWLLVEAIF